MAIEEAKVFKQATVLANSGDGDIVEEGLTAVLDSQGAVCRNFYISEGELTVVGAASSDSFYLVYEKSSPYSGYVQSLKVGAGETFYPPAGSNEVYVDGLLWRPTRDRRPIGEGAVVTYRVRSQVSHYLEDISDTIRLFLTDPTKVVAVTFLASVTGGTAEVHPVVNGRLLAQRAIVSGEEFGFTYKYSVRELGVGAKVIGLAAVVGLPTSELMISYIDAFTI